MRLISAAAFAFLLTLLLAMSGLAQTDALPSEPRPDGQHIFRFDTFGDEQLWTDTLRMHEVLPKVDPATALAVGLKVDVSNLPRLTALKNRYDPTKCFQRNSNVEPRTL